MYKKVKFSIPTENQIYGIFRKRDIIPKMLNMELDNGRLNLFNKISTNANITDYGITQSLAYIDGDIVLNNDYLIETDENSYALASSKGHKKLITKDAVVGIRPIFKYQEFLKHKTHQNKYGIYEFTYGEYPENALTKEETKSIYYKIPDSKLFETTGKTGKIYHLLNKENKIQTTSEYLIDNEKFIIVKGLTGKEGNYTLSTGEEYHKRDNVYIKVKPIIWYLDKESNLAISKNILFTLPLNLGYENIISYLGNCFSKDITSSKKLRKL